MPFVRCNHFTATIVTCDSTTPTGTACVCICKSADGSTVRPRIRNLHSATHGRLVKDTGTPPSGIDAVYDFEHDTTGTQSPGTTVDGDWIPYSGGSVTIRIRYQGPGGPTHFDATSNSPEAC